MSGEAGGSYTEVNGVKMYYELHATGLPLVVLHGAFMTIGAVGALVAALAEARQVVASSSSTSDGVHPEVWEGIEQITPELCAGTTHVGLIGRADWLAPMIAEFLDAPV